MVIGKDKKKITGRTNVFRSPKTAAEMRALGKVSISTPIGNWK
jgi:hypothetical protein